MRSKFALLAGAVTLSLASADGQAAACSGTPPFTDVPAGSFFCTNVEWLKNRAITGGCTDTTYCPNDFVLRSQMAAFLNRLGDKIIGQPVSVNLRGGPITLASLAFDNVLCPAPVIPAVPYPRTFIAFGQASFQMAGSGRGDIGIQILNTFDGDTTNWNFPNLIAQRTSADEANTGAVSHVGVIQVDANQAVKVGIGTFTFSGNTAVVESRCHLTVTLQSRSGESSPFDLPTPPVPAEGS